MPFLCGFVLTFKQEQELLLVVAQVLLDAQADGPRQLLRRRRGRKRPTRDRRF